MQIAGASGKAGGDFAGDIFCLQSLLHQFTPGVGFGGIPGEGDLDVDSQSVGETVFEDSLRDISEFITKGAKL